MTAPGDSDGAEQGRAEGDDHAAYPFAYGHGRMPGFMKLLWVAFLVFITWYVVSFLLPSAAGELAG